MFRKYKHSYDAIRQFDHEFTSYGNFDHTTFVFLTTDLLLLWMGKNTFQFGLDDPKIEQSTRSSQPGENIY